MFKRVSFFLGGGLLGLLLVCITFRKEKRFWPLWLTSELLTKSCDEAVYKHSYKRWIGGERVILYFSACHQIQWKVHYSTACLWCSAPSPLVPTEKHQTLKRGSDWLSGCNSCLPTKSSQVQTLQTPLHSAFLLGCHGSRGRLRHWRWLVLTRDLCCMSSYIPSFPYFFDTHSPSGIYSRFTGLCWNGWTYSAVHSSCCPRPANNIAAKVFASKTKRHISKTLLNI